MWFVKTVRLSPTENYTQAIEEFQACLALQQKYLEAHDRLLAESHYQLALAYHYNSQFDEAVLQFGKSIEVIDKRMGKWVSETAQRVPELSQGKANFVKLP